MKNLLQNGENLDLVAPYDVAAGAGFKVGSIVAVAASAALSGAAVVGVVVGVFDLAKVSAQVWTQGVVVFWDDSAKNVTTTSSGNTLLGVAVAAAANPSATGRVRLSAKFG